jgi:hypothetical protein
LPSLFTPFSQWAKKPTPILTTAFQQSKRVWERVCDVLATGIKTTRHKKIPAEIFGRDKNSTFLGGELVATTIFFVERFDDLAGVGFLGVVSYVNRAVTTLVFVNFGFFHAGNFKQSRFHTGRTSCRSVHPRYGEEDVFRRGFLRFSSRRGVNIVHKGRGAKGSAGNRSNGQGAKA